MPADAFESCASVTPRASGAGRPSSAIEHVGSTSVPALAAKPVIHCDIVVAP